MLYQILRYILNAISIYEILILITVLLSWVDQGGNTKIGGIIRSITDPYLNLFKKIVIPIGNMYLDISPVIGLFVLHLLKRIIVYIFSML